MLGLLFYSLLLEFLVLEEMLELLFQIHFFLLLLLLLLMLLLLLLKLLFF